MTDYTQYVNVFTGCAEIDLPAPAENSPASAWHFIKGLAGNTHPGACLPFGKYSCCAYSGGYSAGYGINRLNCGGTVPKLYSKMPFIGFSHFHHSGTGAIGLYYNYAVTSPEYGGFESFESAFSEKRILAEHGEPGYYSVRTDGIMAEATVSGRTVIHRYTFCDARRLKESGAKLSINFAHDGLYHDKDNLLWRETSGSVRIISDNEAEAEVMLEGVRVYFRVVLSSSSGAALFSGDKTMYGSEYEFVGSDKCGVVFEIAEETVELHMSVSFVSRSHAEKLLCDCESFECARESAHLKWRDALSRIEIETDDSREREIFYSNLYQSLIKPCDLSGESFIDGFESSDGAFVTDIATMWDIYKTELPLLFTLYGGISRKILSSIKNTALALGYYPHCLLLSSNTHIESKQARMLTEFSICDAYYRGIDVDYDTLLDCAVKDAGRFTDFFGVSHGESKNGELEYASHILDMAEASRALSVMAEKLGKKEAAEYFGQYAPRYTEAFGEDGMMRENSMYYEGNRYNYSFRPMYDMNGRIALCGEEKFREECLRFFGFTHKSDFSSRFEGFNNETDMESPYVMLFSGQERELCEVISGGLDCMYTTGRGGIPGNNDSGGLSSCYIWNALGVFPMTGFDKMLISMPRFRKAVLHLHNGKTFTVVRDGAGEYTEDIRLNGRSISRLGLSVSEMMRGGELRFIFR